MKKALLTSDWHIRLDIPTCRDESFLNRQLETLEYIADTARELELPIIHAGDIFHKARPDKSQEIENMLIDIFKGIDIYFIAGNHDLIFHSMENIDRGSLGVLKRIPNWGFNGNHGELVNVYFSNYGESIPSKREIIVLHRYCQVEPLPDWLEDGITADTLLERHPETKVFITGDNHDGFIYEKDNRYVINPGCITRQTADKKYYKPFIVSADFDNMYFKHIYLPDNNPDEVNTIYLENQKIRDNRINSFVSKLEGSVSLDLSFEKNLEIYCKKNNIKESIVNYINKSLEVKK